MNLVNRQAGVRFNSMAGSWKSGLFKAGFRWALILSVALAFSATMARASDTSGADTFKSKCVLCHGADGTGHTSLGKQLQAADLHSKDIQKKSDTELHKTVHDGNGNMPPFGEQLSDDEIDQVIKYVRATFGKAPKK
jgi:mono/diheme cytochrome c family protein